MSKISQLKSTRTTALISLLLLLILLHDTSNVKAIPLRGNFPWTVILCKYRDVPNEQRPREYFVDWITNPSKEGSIANFFRRTSNGIYTIEGSEVIGWLTLAFTKQAVAVIANRDSSLIQRYAEAEERLYHKTKQLCRNTAEHNGFTVFKDVITVINDEDTAIFCTGPGILISPTYWISSALSHEMVHSFHIGHSFSDRTARIYHYAKPGEYDDRYDLMSTANAYMYITSFGLSGPGLNGPHLDYLGWLPQFRIFVFGSDGNFNTDIKLTSLSVPHEQSTDWLLILLPYDRDDPQHVYTLELRTRSTSDRGIRRDALVIHKLMRQEGENGPSYFSQLQTGNPAARDDHYEWGEGEEWTAVSKNFPGQFLRVRVLSVDSFNSVATLHITSMFNPTHCSQAEVPRGAFFGDNVCVSAAAQRALVQAVNEQQALRRLPLQNSNGSCLPGFVSRLANPSDFVCATVDEATQIAKQNLQAQKYANFYKQLTYGANACAEGLVWRALDAYDYVCVLPQKRARYFAQNAAQQRSQPIKSGESGQPIGSSESQPIACAQPNLVKREAIPGDAVCVTTQEKAETESDNEFGRNLLKHKAFFNGADAVD